MRNVFVAILLALASAVSIEGRFQGKGKGGKGKGVWNRNDCIKGKRMPNGKVWEMCYDPNAAYENYLKRGSG